jgi:hypothetical protein
MKIGWFGKARWDNDFAGVWGVANIRLPLAYGLQKAYGAEILDYTMHVDKKQFNSFVKLMGLKKEILKIETSHGGPIDKLDAMIIEARPAEFEEEFEKEVVLIDMCRQVGVPVFIWDMDLWAHDLPPHLKDYCTLLRPYLTHNGDFNKLEEFHYFWNDIFDYQKNAQKNIDLCYVGNQYQRQHKFDKYIGELAKKNRHGIVVAGNWLKESKVIDSIKHKGITFVGEIEHWSCIPLLAHARTTMQIVRDDYSEIGLMTARMFEAFSAGTACLADSEIYGIDQLIPDDWIVENATEIDNLLNNDVGETADWSEFEEKMKPHYYLDRAEQLVRLIE